MKNNKNKIVTAIWCVIVFVASCGISYYSISHFTKTKNTCNITYQTTSYVSTTTAQYVYKNITFNVITTYLNGSSDFYSKSLEIYQNDKLLITQDGDSDISPLDQAFGVDITGNGGKDFVFVDLSDGSGNFVSYHIYELPKNGTITKIAELDTSGDATFKDLTGNGRLDVEIGDMTFNCWESACASSPNTKVILSWNSAQQSYVMNPNLMRKPAPTQNTIQQMANYFRDDDWCGYNPGGTYRYCEPWDYALDLIYSGNAVSAKSYLNLVWSFASSTMEKNSGNGNFSSKKDLENQLLSNLKSSEYYTTILSLNGGKIF